MQIAYLYSDLNKCLTKRKSFACPDSEEGNNTSIKCTFGVFHKLKRYLTAVSTLIESSSERERERVRELPKRTGGLNVLNIRGY